MVDLSITASQVVKDANAVTQTKTAGATITAGQAVYLDSADNKYKLADADSSAATADAKGIALHASSDGQPLTIIQSGILTLGAGAAPAVGTVYVVSGTAGGIAPVADLASGDYTTVLGVGGTTNTLHMGLYASGQLVP